MFQRVLYMFSEMGAGGGGEWRTDRLNCWFLSEKDWDVFNDADINKKLLKGDDAFL